MNHQAFDISIIILNYNAAPFLPDCLDSIEAQTGINVQTIVVDNHSTDNSVELIKKNYPKVILVQRDTSVGFAAGNNRGVEKAAAPLVLFLNPDTKFIGQNDLKRCVDKYNQTKSVGALTCRVDLAITKSLDVTCHRGFPTPWASLTYFSGLSKLFPQTKLFGQYLQSYKDFNKEHQVDAVGGMFLLVSKQIGDEVGWWDEDYPLYGEDLDFCYRIHQKGYRNIYWPEVTILHYKGASTGMSKHSKKVTTASKQTTKRVKLWSIEAMRLFYDKHYKKRYPKIVTALVYVGISVLKFIRTR